MWFPRLALHLGLDIVDHELVTVWGSCKKAAVGEAFLILKMIPGDTILSLSLALHPQIQKHQLMTLPNAWGVAKVWWNGRAGQSQAFQIFRLLPELLNWDAWSQSCGWSLLKLVVDNGRCVPSETPIQIAVLSLQLATRIRQDSSVIPLKDLRSCRSQDRWCLNGLVPQLSDHVVLWMFCTLRIGVLRSNGRSDSSTGSNIYENNHWYYTHTNIAILYNIITPWEMDWISSTLKHICDKLSTFTSVVSQPWVPKSFRARFAVFHQSNFWVAA